ncbi:MAG: sulfotransferase family 2 domain-containing protein [Longimicrobiales bacterium]
MNREEPGPDGTLIYLHIPKTAGRTFVKILRDQYGKARVYEAYSTPPDTLIDVYKALPVSEKTKYRAIAGHVAPDMHLSVPGPSLYVTMLREPLRRALSTYQFIRRQQSHPAHAAVTENRMTLEQVMTSGVDPMLSNGHVRALIGRHVPYGTNDRALLEEAIANLHERIGIFGLTERFDEAIMLMKRRFGWRGGFYSRRNSSPERLSVNDVPRSTIDAIRGYNALDFALYGYAAARVAESARGQGLAFRSRVKVFSFLNGARGRSHKLAARVPLLARSR